MRLLIAMLALAITGPALAKPQTLTFDYPVQFCDGTPLALADVAEVEIIYSESPMPMPSDDSGPCAAAVDPGAPAGSTTVPVPAGDTSVTLNLQPGVTYYARARLSAPTAGNWSSWSIEYSFTVPYGRPDVIKFTDMAFPVQYETVAVAHLAFFQ